MTTDKRYFIKTPPGWGIIQLDPGMDAATVTACIYANAPDGATREGVDRVREIISGVTGMELGRTIQAR